MKIGEVSIIIASSSPHRKEALNATENILESVKKFAPIWKKVCNIKKKSKFN